MMICKADFEELFPSVFGPKKPEKQPASAECLKKEARSEAPRLMLRNSPVNDNCREARLAL
ncbi:hypothetical protein [Aliiroseovarius sediminis]|uniref:hypothetical protein n=1 Tax=Aliiroseovarius sediminis TaxID=2925839 RepID=UPI001F5AFCF9|nr:hypothetical protein [Aliiroseovarius sediminis]MCI2394932.1 hypothetical protein [Aliiroseovarius sediminis]